MAVTYEPAPSDNEVHSAFSKLHSSVIGASNALQNLIMFLSSRSLRAYCAIRVAVDHPQIILDKMRLFAVNGDAQPSNSMELFFG